MRVVGIDYASRGFMAIALVVGGDLTRHMPVFKSSARADESDPVMLIEYEHWLNFQLALLKPDVVAVEHLAVFQNKNTIRALAHREAVALLVAKKRAPIVVHYRITSARSVIFPKGNISKDDAWTMREKVFPGTKFKMKTAGGVDQMDAGTLALAAPTLMERGK